MSHWINSCDCPAGLSCDCDRRSFPTIPEKEQEPKCDFCTTPCGNDHCPTKEQK